MSRKGTRRISLFFVLMLLLQTLLTSSVLPAQVTAVGRQANIKTEVTDYHNDSKTGIQTATVDVEIKWSVENIEVNPGDTQVVQLDSHLIVQQEQDGEIVTKDNTTVGHFKATTDGAVSITFDEDIIDHPDASGSFVVNVVVETEVSGDEEVDEKHKELGEEAEKVEEKSVSDLEKANRKEVVSGLDEEDSAENENMSETESGNSLEDESSETVIEIDEEEELEEAADKGNLWSNIVDFFRFGVNSEEETDEKKESTEIKENIITDVTLTLKDKDDNVIPIDPDKPIRIEDPYNQYKVHLRYDFVLPNGHDYEAGATYQITLPDMLRMDNNPEEIELKDEDGEVFASFTVEDNEIIIVFNELIEEKSNIAGYIDAESDFIAYYDGEADTDLTFPITGDSEISFPIQFVPKGKSIDKEGIGDKGYNTETIKWRVDFNKDFQEIENAVLMDELTEGDQSYIAGSLKVYLLNLNADGTVHSTEELSGYGDTFPLQLGDIDSAYRVTYETTVNDREGKTYRNKATLEGDNIDSVDAGATVTVTRGKALDKDATKYDDVKQMITWEVKYNYDEKMIDQGKARLVDEFGEKQTLYSFEVFEVEINQDTGAEEGTTRVSSDDYTVVESSNGFEFQFNSNINKPYKIVYQTIASERIFDDLDVQNIIRDEFENESKGGQTIRQGIFIKNHNRDRTDYDTKETSWTVLINRDKQPMDEVVFTDILPEGMTPKNLSVTHGDISLNEGTDYTYDYDENTRKIEIEFINEITDTVYITYDTEIDFDIVDWENISFKNNAYLEWIPENESIKVDKTATALFTPDDYTHHNGFKGGSYNPVDKTITWTIGVNYNKANLNGVVVEDYIQGDQNFKIENVKVYHMELTGGAYGYEKGAEVTNPNVQSVTNSENEPGFSVTLGNINTPYMIEFTTDLNDQLIVGNYDNRAIVTTSNRGESELEAKVEPVHGGEYTKKSAEQNEANPRIINWNIDINFTQSTLNNVKITDTPSINQALRKDSFVLYGTTVTESGLKKDPNTILEAGTDYTLAFTEDEHGQESFTLELTGEIKHGYVLEYDTYILYTGGENGEHNRITNDAKFNANENIPGETDYQFNEAINLSKIGGGITGQVGSLEVTKVDANDADITLEGAVFELYDETGEVLLRTTETDEHGVAEFKNLLYGDYILKETKAPQHYVVGIVDQQTVTVDKQGTELMVKNEKIKQHFELMKVDDKDRTPLGGVKFDLYEGTPSDGTLVESGLTTDSDGKILIEHLPGGNADDGLPAGDYYLKETSTVEHYKILEDPIVFRINQDQTVVTTQTVRNKLEPGSVSFIKVDSETNEQLSGAEFDVVYVSYGNNTYNETVDQVTTDAENPTLINDLRPGEYKLVEVTAPSGYEKLTEDISFTIEESQETTKTLPAIENEVKTTNFVLTKQDAVTKENLAGGQFKLTYTSGGYNVPDQTEFTDAEGKITFKNLKPGTYELTEASAPEGYIKKNNAITVEVTLEDVHLNRNVTETVENAPFAHITLAKIDSDSNALLEGAVFKVVDEDNNDVLTDLTTNSQGMISITGLSAGEYKLVETEAPFGYTIGSGPAIEREFTITGEETETSVFDFTGNDAVENDIIKGSLELTKEDFETGEPLESVTFTLENVDLVNEGNADLSVFRTESTNDQGKIVFDNLRPGTYKLIEITTIDGYQLHPKEIEVQINLQDTKHEQTITIKNHQLVDIPVKKDWNDNDNVDNRPDEIEVKLYRSDNVDEPIETATLTADDQWRHTFTDLNAIDAEGVAYEYTVKESSTDGYKLESISGNQDIGFIIKNVELTSIDISKKWLDDEDHTYRPEEIIVELLRNGEPVAKEELNEANDWKSAFSGLEIYDPSGKLYEYSVQEKNINENYELSSITGDTEEGFVIRNVRVGETDIEVTKEWLDDEGTAARPDDSEGVTIYLFQKLHNEYEYPDEPLREETITPGNDNWEYVFKSVPLFNENGVAYEYEVREEPVEGYKSKVIETEDGFEITNTRTGTTSVSGEKKWKHDEGVPEPAVQVQLYQNGVPVQDQIEIASAKTDWKYEFTDLDEFDDEGKPYEYSVREVEVPAGYVSTVDGYDITNTRVGTTELAVSKVWLDEDSEARPDDSEGVTIYLFQKLHNEDEYPDEPLREETITPGNDNWEYVFKSVPLFNENGVAYEYEVREEPVEGYKSNVIETEDGFEITNTRTGTTSVSGKKTWKHDEGVPEPAVQVQLYQNGVPVQDQIEIASAETDLKYEFTELDEFDDEGKPYEYSVREVEVPAGYVSTVDGYDITNTRVGTIELAVSKVWLDEDSEDRPDSITLQLYQNDIHLEDKDVPVPNPGNEYDKWEYVFENLPAFDEDGKAYTYTVEEVVLDGYKQASNVTNSDGSITITNVRSDEIEIDVTKTWIDTEETADRPESITIQLFQKGEDGEEDRPVANSTQVITPDADGKWEHTYTNIPKYDGEGKAIKYVVKEQKVPGYTAIASVVENGNAEIKNVRTGTTAITGTKTWHDDNSPDRPELILVNLLQNGVVVDTKEVTAKDNWTYSFTDLAKYNEKGIAYEYTITEQDVPGYQSQVDGYNITNTRSEQKDITITKGWLDNHSEDRPDLIQVQLLQNGERFGEPVDVKAEDNWSYEFRNLEAYDEEGVAYEYSIEELAVEGYEPTIDGFNITNLRVGTTDVSGVKTWIEVDESYRPESITVNLFANGEKVADVEVTEEDDWTYGFRNLPKYDDQGKAITYTIDEEPVIGYEKEITGTDILNTQVTIDVSGNKIWKDDDSEERPESITIYLLQNGEVFDSYDVTAEDDWKYSFTELVKYDKEGNEYTYTVEEEPISGYESTVDGYDLTNLRVGITSITVTKEWKNDNETVRPNSITVKLLQNGEVIEKVEVLAANNWVYTFEDLPLYDENGIAYVYTIDEVPVEGYEPTIEGYNITNTYDESNAEEVSGSSKDPSSEEKETEGTKLPKTATDMYNYIAIGILMLSLAFTVMLYSRRRDK